jgi:asparaginyl-tRNA synthetase
MRCAEDFFKFLCKWILDNCSEDLKFVLKRIDKTCIVRLQSMISSTFEKISYTEAVDNLKQVDHSISSLGISF